MIKVAIFEPYIFDRAYGNLRYISTIYKYSNKEKYKHYFLTPTKTLFHKRLSSSNVECIVLHPDKRINDYGGKILRNNVFNKFKTLLSLLKYNYKIISLINEKRIDILQCHNIRSIFMSALFKYFSSVKVVLYIKGHLDNPLLDFVSFLLSDVILFQNKKNLRRTHSLLLRIFSKKISLLKNGIDLLEIDSISSEKKINLYHQLGLCDKYINFIYVGQLSNLKGLDYLLDAFIRLETDNKVKLFVVGDECSREFLPFVQYIKNKYKNKNINYLGWRDDVLDLVAIMDVFVLPSLSEGVPKSIIEAMALGKPVIATHVGGVGELINHNKTGFIVPPEDSKALYRYMLKLTNSQELKNEIGTAAKKVAYNDYSVIKNIRNLEIIYDGLLK